MVAFKDRSRKYSNPAKRTLQERVRKSALILDRLLPGWHQKIDTQDFNMGDPKRCIVGNLERAYSVETINNLGLDCLNIGMGFYNPTTYQHTENGSAQLKPIWLNQIKKRKAVDAMYRC